MDGVSVDVVLDLKPRGSRRTARRLSADHAIGEQIRPLARQKMWAPWLKVDPVVQPAEADERTCPPRRHVPAVPAIAGSARAVARRPARGSAR